MAKRVGLGPVFAFEWLMTSRRWQAYGMRSLTVLVLLGAMTLGWYESGAGRWGADRMSIRQQAQVGKTFFGVTAMSLLGLVGLAAPAATAGAICLDKARGNLTLLFATDLSNTEIVLGKLAAKLVPVLGLILCAAPVLAVGTLFGGIDPVGLIGALLVIFSVAIFGCSLALTISVWGKKTHEVLMMTYVFGIVYLLAAPILSGIFMMMPRSWPIMGAGLYEMLLRFNPVFLVIAVLEAPPMFRPVTFWTDLQFLALALSASGVLVGVSIWRIRSVVVRQLGRGDRPARRRSIRERMAGALTSDRLGRWAPGTVGLARGVQRVWPVPSLDRNPVYWRECQRKRPSWMSLVSWGAYVLLCGGFSLFAIAHMMMGHFDGVGMGLFVNTMQVSLGLLLLSATAATSLAEERQRGSLDVLLATPMSTRAIVLAKWRGTFRSVPLLLILPSAVATAHSFSSGRHWAVALMAVLILAYGAAITSLGLAMATWTARMGRAIGLTVGIYVCISIAWPFFAMTVFGTGHQEIGIGMASASPFVGIASYNSLIANMGPQNEFSRYSFWILFWTICYLGAAVGLLLATIGSFNRCLGRIDDLSGWDTDDLTTEPTREDGEGYGVGVQVRGPVAPATPDSAIAKT